MDRVIARVSIAVIKRHNQKPLGKGPSPSPTQAPVFMGFIAPGDATSKQFRCPWEEDSAENLWTFKKGTLSPPGAELFPGEARPLASAPSEGAKADSV